MANDRIYELHEPSMLSVSHPVIPVVPQCRRPIRSETFEESYRLDNNSQKYSYMKDKISNSQSIKKPISPISKHTSPNINNQNDLDDGQITDEDLDEDLDENLNESDEEVQYARSKKRFETNSSEKTNESTSTQQTTNNIFYLLIFCIVIAIIFLALHKKESTNKEQMQSIISASSVPLESIEDVKTRFRNQDSDIWNDISSGINEVITRSPKIPSIILLFANETTTMDCFASTLAHMSSTILGSDSPLYLNPEDFGDDPGEIINTLKETRPTKKAVIIYDVLNINANAIRALHNLCDRINPLIGEIIYIITMQTKNYKSSQKKLSFVEGQIYDKLSKNIDRDILMALVARITDGVIISVQPEPNLQYCLKDRKTQNFV